jgi:hypothetical protein
MILFLLALIALIGFAFIAVIVAGSAPLIIYITVPIPAILFGISLFQLIKVRCCLKPKEQLEIKHKITLLKSFRFIVWGLVVLLFVFALVALFLGGFNG